MERDPRLPIFCRGPEGPPADDLNPAVSVDIVGVDRGSRLVEMAVEDGTENPALANWSIGPRSLIRSSSGLSMG